MSLRIFNFDKTFHRGETEFQFHILEDYLEASETSILALKKKALDDISNYIRQNELNSDELKELEFRIMSSVGMYNLEFSTRFRYSFIVQLVSLAEQRFKSLCDAIDEKNSSTLPKLNRNPQDSFINSFEKWITDHTSGKSLLWSKADSLNSIRNCIVHSGGKAKKDKALKTIEALGSIDGNIKIDDQGYIFIEKQFCIDSLETMSQLFNDLYTSLGFGEGLHFGSRMPTNMGFIIDSNFSPPKLQVYEGTSSGIEKLLPE